MNAEKKDTIRLWALLVLILVSVMLNYLEALR